MDHIYSYDIFSIEIIGVISYLLC